jgi:hypothetical protein
MPIGKSRFAGSNIMHDCVPLSRDWKRDLAQLIMCSRSRLTISSPYVTREGISFLLTTLGVGRKSLSSLRFITDLSPGNVCDGATDPAALAMLASHVPAAQLRHLPRLHAKVYIADASCAIVTSGNLTAGGLERNYEYGVKIVDRATVSTIFEDISGYSELGAIISADGLAAYCEIAERVRSVYQRQRDSARHSLQVEFQQQLEHAELELARFRLAEGPMHTVFAKTILYLLSKYGPLSTEELHPRIQSIHPDLCDDEIERIIDGKRFGKKWKHAVRSAQQQLKRQGLVVLSGGCWRRV